MKHLRKNITLLIAFSMLIISTTSCQKDDTDKAPSLPPMGTMAMDFSEFISAKTTEHTIVSNANRNLAVVHVTVWNTVVFLNMAIPVAAFKEAFNHSPVFKGNGTWEWTYSVDVGIFTLSARLEAVTDGNTADWTMYLSKTGPGAFKDYVWFTGTSKLDGSGGSWILNNTPDNAKPFVKIEWSANDNVVAKIKYTNIIPGAAENGGYITHGRNSNIPFNAFYKIYSKAANNMVEIFWNTETKAGKIKDPNHFKNQNFHCWNSDGVNITCP